MKEPQTLATLRPELRAELEAIDAMTDPEAIKAELARLVGLTIETVLKIGRLIVRLDALGYDVDELRFAALPAYRRVGHNQTLPEIVVMLAGSAALLMKVARLPLADQRRIAAGETLRVMTRDGDARAVPLLAMNTAELKQVIAPDRIRNDAEQAAYLRAIDEACQTKPQAATPDNFPIRIDRRRGGIHCGPRYISAGDLAHYLSLLSEKPNSNH